LCAQSLCSCLLSSSYVLTCSGNLMQCGSSLTCCSIPFGRDAGKNTSTKIFWSLMAGGCSLWLTAQVLWSILEIFYRKSVPNPFVGDIALFLHFVPLMAMLALRADQVRSRRRILDQVDFGMLFVWWVYLYLFIVIPWQYVRLNSAFYSETSIIFTWPSTSFYFAP
jgi:hypothetical protein